MQHSQIMHTHFFFFWVCLICTLLITLIAPLQDFYCIIDPSESATPSSPVIILIKANNF